MTLTLEQQNEVFNEMDTDLRKDVLDYFWNKNLNETIGRFNIYLLSDNEVCVVDTDDNRFYFQYGYEQAIDFCLDNQNKLIK